MRGDDAALGPMWGYDIHSNVMPDLEVIFNHRRKNKPHTHLVPKKPITQNRGPRTKSLQFDKTKTKSP